MEGLVVEPILLCPPSIPREVETSWELVYGERAVVLDH